MLAGNAKSSAPTSSFKTQESAKQSSSQAGKGKREDNEAQLEILRNVKIFLTDKVKKSEEIIKTLQNDVEGLKNYLRVEKQVQAKTQQQLTSREKELEELRRESLDKESDLRLKINELSTKTADKDKQIEDLV